MAVNIRKTLLFTTWLSLLGSSGAVVFYLEVYGLQTRDGTKIASINSYNGDIKYRSEYIAAWYSAVDKQELFKGDRVSTGIGSSANIKFDSGQTVELEENSQIKIEAISKNKNDIKITLLKGYVAASGSDKAGITLSKGWKRIHFKK